ncbi:hypothetical protein lerEdw1_006239 [Lerista edwardsae]|nr:hypothetical protein lerEdw1_006239 [Lerista edwardsae]
MHIFFQATEEEGQTELKLPESPMMESKGQSFNLLVEPEQGHQYTPILASAHEDGCLCLWTITGDLLKEILPFTKHPPIPLTALCTDLFAKMLFASNKEGHVIRWHIGSFLEDPMDPNKHAKQQICWRAHSIAIVSLFYDDERNIVVTGSMDCSIRFSNNLWKVTNQQTKMLVLYLVVYLYTGKIEGDREIELDNLYVEEKQFFDEFILSPLLMPPGWSARAKEKLS